MVYNTLKYVSYKDRGGFTNDPKTSYHAPDERTDLIRLDDVVQSRRPNILDARNAGVTTETAPAPCLSSRRPSGRSCIRPMP